MPRQAKRVGKGAPKGQLPKMGVVVNDWTIMAHPLFLDAIEKLTDAAARERADSKGASGPHAKLLAHLSDLAFVKIPSDPGGAQFRHGGTLGGDQKHWFRAKTGGGRYRLFYRFHSKAKIIILGWVNDEESLRTYGSKKDAYRVFADMLASGNPPGDWDELMAAAWDKKTVARLQGILKKSSPK